MIVLLDQEKFFDLFKPTEQEKDPWRRVAAYQYNISYNLVTIKQRLAMKQLYYMYAYSAKPEKMASLLGYEIL